jgi:hypothetical protein
MIDSIARGHTKDIYGPVLVAPGLLFQDATVSIPAHLFRFADSIHAVRAGRLPDLIPGRGVASASIHAYLHGALQSQKSWFEFLKSEEATSVRKSLASIHTQPGAGLSGDFNELAFALGKSGLRTSYLGVVSEEEF